jgi:hypothetical protein
LTNAFVDVLRRIPELVADLDQASPSSIQPYIDFNPDKNSIQMAIYDMKEGSVLVVFDESYLLEGELSANEYVVRFILKAKKGQSVYDLAKDIGRGVPVPGDTQRWYRCPVMDGVYPTEIAGSARATDEEYIDYWTILTKTKEIGDQ